MGKIKFFLTALLVTLSLGIASAQTRSVKGTVTAKIDGMADVSRSLEGRVAGVIVITTKKGRAGSSQINYTGEYTVRLKPSYTTF